MVEIIILVVGVLVFGVCIIKCSGKRWVLWMRLNNLVLRVFGSFIFIICRNILIWFVGGCIFLVFWVCLWFLLGLLLLVICGGCCCCLWWVMVLFGLVIFFLSIIVWLFLSIFGIVWLVILWCLRIFLLDVFVGDCGVVVCFWWVVGLVWW